MPTRGVLSPKLVQCIVANCTRTLQVSTVIPHANRPGSLASPGSPDGQAGLECVVYGYIAQKHELTRVREGDGDATILVLSGFSPASLGRALVGSWQRARRNGASLGDISRRGVHFFSHFANAFAVITTDISQLLGRVSSIFRGHSHWLPSIV
ncbi:hypothetical protein CGRA01v4_01561 [Colletotrichum graminicola]|nr:hypothetical protein CGRA01v4_01561 [Colletotrichum graminicola]